MIEQVKRNQTKKTAPFAYSVKAGVVSRIVQVSPAFSEHLIITRRDLTESQLAEMEVRS